MEKRRWKHKTPKPSKVNEREKFVVIEGKKLQSVDDDEMKYDNHKRSEWGRAKTFNFGCNSCVLCYKAMED